MRKTQCEACGWKWEPFSEHGKPPAYCYNCRRPFDPIEYLLEEMQKMLKVEKEKMEAFGDDGFGCYAGRVQMLEHWIGFLETFGDQIMGREYPKTFGDLVEMEENRG